ncbi:hypothetical protein [Thermococcus gammatolerans]|uniref:Uncharacterized protein n=1 Tax=Thermococcus gammatolerans (strain DSM 15229 / JCM 11827 / EJ3) TaxID=593117 RepID=C5A6Z9_THEGJ|nr:hypothetical protein [Thermococcus gammatolerans]ACS34011.1 Hypothetical protein TGAM_1509 [Thermococcus gammatolerans EJ3]
MLIANHVGKEHKDIGWAVGDAIYEYFVKQGKTVEDVEKNPSEFAKLVVKKLQEREVVGPTVARSTQKAIKEVIPATIKLINKMWPKDHNIKHLRAMEEAFSPDTKDPVRTLKAAGIDVTKELEELRNTIAEVTGKKPKTAKKRGMKKIEPRKPKYPETKKVISEEIPPEVLSIAKALEFSDFSEKAMEKAEKELLKMIDGLLDDEANAVEVFYAVKLLRLVQRGDIEGIKRFGD